MQAFLDRQFAFDTYLPGTPHELGELVDLFPFHIWGRGAVPANIVQQTKDREALRKVEAVRRRRYPSSIEEAAAYGNLSYIILQYAQGHYDVLQRRASYEGSDASALMWAAFKGHLPVVKFLVDIASKECARVSKPADAAAATATAAAAPHTVDVSSRYYTTNRAAAAGGAQGAKSAGAGAGATADELFDRFVNYSSNLGHTALQWAIIGGHAAVVRFLLDNNASPTRRDRQGFDAAFVAVQNNQFPILLMLLEDSIAAGAITLQPRAGGAAPTASAAAPVAVNVAAKPQSLPRGGDAQAPPATVADGVYVVHKELLTALNGTTDSSAADVSAVPSRRSNYYALDLSLRDVEGHSLMHWAAYRNSRAMCEYLLLRWRYGVDVVDTHGRTPLIWAAREGFAEVMELLLLCGADRYAKDKDGCSALQYVRIRNHPEAAHVVTSVPLFEESAFALSSSLSSPPQELGTHSGSGGDDGGAAGGKDTDRAATTALEKKFAAYVPLRTRRAYGTLRMILTEKMFALQAACGTIFMGCSYVLLAVAPPVFSYFPYGLYFFKNILWTLLLGRPYRSSVEEAADVGKQFGLASSLAESVRGTWRFRLREPANLFAIVAMMCLQMHCWAALGLTPFVSPVFSFNFLFAPLSASRTASWSLQQSPLYAHVAESSCSGMRGFIGAWQIGENCSDSRAAGLGLRDYIAAFHDEATTTKKVAGGTAETVRRRGRNVLSEVPDAQQFVHEHFMWTSKARAISGGRQLFEASSYPGGEGVLSYIFHEDGLAMVSIMLPLLFTLTLLFFFLTKQLAHRSFMRPSPSTAPAAVVKRCRASAPAGARGRADGDGDGGDDDNDDDDDEVETVPLRHRRRTYRSSYEEESSLAESPLWRVLRSRQFAWLHPRALMTDRHTQLPARAFYCEERDVIVHRYDSYSALLDCPIGASNHLFFVLGLTCLTLFELCLFFWGSHQLRFFTGQYNPVRCERLSWLAGWSEGFLSAEKLQTRLTAYLERVPAAVAAITGVNGKAAPETKRGGSLLTDPSAVRCAADVHSVVQFDWLNNVLNLFVHGLPRRQEEYAYQTLASSLVRAPSPLRRVVHVFLYYWWPTPAQLYSAFLLHFAFYSMTMAAAIAVRQWSGVWRGATRMELSNPLTPCPSFEGRLIATLPAQALFTGSTIHKDYEGGTTTTAASAAANVEAQLCTVSVDEEFYYNSTDPSKARRPVVGGPGFFVKSIYADSRFAVVNCLAFLAGRAGKQWDGAMAVSEHLAPVRAPMLSEYE